MPPGPRLFKDIPEVSAATLEILDAQGFDRATAVQDAVIPLFCGNKDVAVDACTGSGKTLSFVIPIVEKLRKLETTPKRWQVTSIVISPTRELAKQIFKVAEPFVNSVRGVRAVLLVGGTDPAADVADIKTNGANVLIGTPGRIDDIIKRASLLELRELDVLVLDEADRLLDMGFKRQLDAIMAVLPRQRRTGLFSATQTEAVEELVRAGLRNPYRVKVAVVADGKGGETSTLDQRTPSTLRIGYVVCEADVKLPQLVSFLRQHKQEKVIVYFLTCACVSYFAAALPQLKQLAGVNILAVHGKLKQSARERTLAAFTDASAGM